MLDMQQTTGTAYQYSPSIGSFYPTSMQYPNLPTDLIDTDEDTFLKCINRAAGETLDVIDGKIVIVPAPIIPDSVLIEQAITSAKYRIDTFHSETVSKLVGSPTQVEKDTWAVKLSIAEQILKLEPLSDSGKMFLNTAGYITDEDKQQWANKVVTKAKNYTLVLGLAEKLRDSAKDAIKIATRVTEVDAILEAMKHQANQAIQTLLSTQ